MPIRTRCSPTSTSRGRSEWRGESVDQIDHDRVRGLTVLGVRGGLAVRAPRVAILRGCGGRRAGWRGAWERCALRRRHDRNGHRARHEFSHAGWHRPDPSRRGPSVLSRMSSPPPRGHCGGTVINFVVCVAGMRDEKVWCILGQHVPCHAPHDPVDYRGRRPHRAPHRPTTRPTVNPPRAGCASFPADVLRVPVVKCMVRWVPRCGSRGGVEPPTFRFGVEPAGQYRTLLNSAR